MILRPTMTTLKTIAAFLVITSSIPVCAQMSLVGVVASPSGGGGLSAHELSTGTIYTLDLRNSSNRNMGFNLYDSNLNYIGTQLFPIQPASNELSAVYRDYLERGYLTNTLFDNDPTTLEYVHQLVEQGGTARFAVCRVGGGVLYYFASNAGGLYLDDIVTRPEGTRMLTTFAGNSYNMSVVYELGGSIPCTDCSGNVINVVGGSDERLDEIQPLQPKSFNMFPNPANETLSIEFDYPEDIQQAELVIMNTLGQEVKRLRLSEVELQQVSISDLDPGSYLCTLFKEDGALLAPGQMLVVE